MPKGYWVTTYGSVSDPDALARYAALAGRAIEDQGGRILARGIPVRVYESGEPQRAVVVEFASVEAAIAAYESSEYQKVRSILEGAVEREVRIVEGA